MDRRVRAERASGAVVFGRWRAARRAAVPALRTADPRRSLEWADAALKPKTLATTRLAEHWAHGLDITEPLGIPFPDTNRLWHIAWLAHSSLPYAFDLAGKEPGEVFCGLTAPDHGTWRYGPAEADSTITGSASAFCRVAAHRLPADASELEATSPYGRVAVAGPAHLCGLTQTRLRSARSVSVTRSSDRLSGGAFGARMPVAATGLAQQERIALIVGRKEHIDRPVLRLRWFVFYQLSTCQRRGRLRPLEQR